MTKRGFAWEDKRLSFSEVKIRDIFYSWSQIQIVENYIMVGKKDYLELERFERDRKEVYETKWTFEKRKKNFGDLILSYVDKYNQERNVGSLVDTYICAYDSKEKLKIWPRCTSCKKSNNKLYYFCQFCGKNLIAS